MKNTHICYILILTSAVPILHSGYNESAPSVLGTVELPANWTKLPIFKATVTKTTGKTENTWFLRLRDIENNEQWEFNGNPIYTNLRNFGDYGYNPASNKLIELVRKKDQKNGLIFFSPPKAHGSVFNVQLMKESQKRLTLIVKSNLPYQKKIIQKNNATPISVIRTPMTLTARVSSLLSAEKINTKTNQAPVIHNTLSKTIIIPSGMLIAIPITIASLCIGYTWYKTRTDYDAQPGKSDSFMMLPWSQQATHCIAYLTKQVIPPRETVTAVRNH